jgi:hypothetical protein
MISEIYLTFLTTTVVALFGLVIRVCYKSKCDKVEVCCIKIHRNTEQETELSSNQLRGGSEDSMKLENIYKL